MLEIMLEIIYWCFLCVILSILWGFFWGDKLFWWRRRRKISKILMQLLIYNKEFENRKIKKLNQLGLSASKAGKVIKGFINTYSKMDKEDEKK